MFEEPKRGRSKLDLVNQNCGPYDYWLCYQISNSCENSWRYERFYNLIRNLSRKEVMPSKIEGRLKNLSVIRFLVLNNIRFVMY